MNNNINKDVDILARTIYGEARGEIFQYGIAALIAVANVVVNRFQKKFAKTIADVCLAPYQFSCWNKDDVNYKIVQNVAANSPIFRKCLIVAQNVISGKWPDLTDGCDHYHHQAIKPTWAMYLEPKRIFGSHCFYNLGGKK